MKFVAIKQEKKSNGSIVFTIPALSLDAKNGSKRKIPHPLGKDILEFSTVEEAQNAVKLAGFDCILPDGIKINNTKANSSNTSYDEKILTALLKEADNVNPNIVAAALNALSEINHENCVNIYLDKIGEDNEQIRENAINALVKCGNNALPEIFSALKSDNWVKRNSAISCLKRLCDYPDVPATDIIDALLGMLNDNNPIVKCSAISALGDFYKVYKNSKIQ